MTFSSDLVFDGTLDRPYVESDKTAPLGVYGRSKADAERRVLDSDPQALVIRTSAFFGPWDEHNFVTQALNALDAGQPFAAASDQTVSPTYVPDLVNVCLDLLIDREYGVWHLTNGAALSWADLARRACAAAGVDAGQLEERTGAELGLRAARPRNSALSSERGLLLPSLDDALARYLREREIPHEQAGSADAQRQLSGRT
jgi:dTDP-4-dehydrorhamnose reductase